MLSMIKVFEVQNHPLIFLGCEISVPTQKGLIDVLGNNEANFGPVRLHCMWIRPNKRLQEFDEMVERQMQQSPIFSVHSMIKIKSDTVA